MRRFGDGVRVFWMAALVGCAVGCSLMILKVKEKLDVNPMIVTFAESTTNIWHLPFPAVTICPLTKSRRSLFNFTKYANMIRDGAELQGDYESWVEKLFTKMATHIYRDKDMERYNLTWIDDRVGPEQVSYGDAISDEMAVLLDQIFVVIVAEDEFSKNRHFENSTWIKGKFAQLKNQSEDLRQSINKYYPAWRNEIYQKLRALHTVCKVESDYWKHVFEDNGASFTALEEAAIRFLIKVAPSMISNEGIADNTITWDGSRFPLTQFFKHMWTDEGVCFTFNMMDNNLIYSDEIVTNKMFWHPPAHSNDWNPDTGYSTKASRNTYPRRPLGVGKDGGVVLELNEISDDIDYLCHDGGASGYKIILHRPEDQPASQLNYVAEVPFMKDVSIAVFPLLMTTSPGLDKYDPHKRQCYYSHENHLEYFKLYSQNNCVLECLTKTTLKKCGCVAFYMPRNYSTRICGKDAASCIFDAAKEVERREIDEDLHNFSEGEEGTFGTTVTAKTECDCLPSCVTISYEAIVSMVDIDVNKFLEASEAKEHRRLKKEASHSSIHIFFKDKYLLAARRSEIYGEIDFLANCGGLLGLFSGFSIISLIEIFYFLTIRPLSNLYRRLTEPIDTTDEEKVRQTE